MAREIGCAAGKKLDAIGVVGCSVKRPGNGYGIDSVGKDSAQHRKVLQPVGPVVQVGRRAAIVERHAVGIQVDAQSQIAVDLVAQDRIFVSRVAVCADTVQHVVGDYISLTCKRAAHPVVRHRRTEEDAMAAVGDRCHTVRRHADQVSLDQVVV